MAIDYRYLSNLNCLLLRFRDALSASDFAAAFDRAARDPEIPPHYLRFSDLRLVSTMPVVSDIKEMAREADASDARKAPLRSAILVGPDHHFGLARLFHAHRGPSQEKVNIFRNYAEASLWLGLPGGLGDLFLDEGRWS